ncbi:thymidylate synthase [Methanocrinis sp.]|uniref:thymidylate synthase n=1 Tax=Methanocrinis sp. TaxID=3101522 RepID=UPI003D0BDD82
MWTLPDHGGFVRVGRFIRAETIPQAWRRGLNLIWRQGEEITDERGTRTREVLALEVVVEDPRRDMIPEEYSWNRPRLEDYAGQLISGENPGFEYTYGERLRSWTLPGSVNKKEENVIGPVDQIDYVVRRLRANPNSRRASAVTWIPPVDTKKEEVPCMMVDDFKIREGRLHLAALFRSHDFAGAYPANLYGLTRLLEYVGERVGAEPGSITTVSCSAHIYDHDWDWVSEMVTGGECGEI